MPARSQYEYLPKIPVIATGGRPMGCAAGECGTDAHLHRGTLSTNPRKDQYRMFPRTRQAGKAPKIRIKARPLPQHLQPQGRLRRTPGRFERLHSCVRKPRRSEYGTQGGVFGERPGPQTHHAALSGRKAFIGTSPKSMPDSVFSIGVTVGTASSSVTVLVVVPPSV